MSEKKLTNIQVYKRKPSMNIGVFIFGIVFVYMIIIILSSLTHKSISTYEVRTGSIQKEASYTGIAVRKEEVFYAQEGGYINYLVPEGSKVGVQTKTFSISKKTLDFSKKGEEEQSLNREEEEAIYHKILSFQDGYRSEDFRDVYSLKEQLLSLLSEKSNLTRQNQLESMEVDNNGISTYAAEKDGVIQYSVDGYENLQLDKISKKQIEKTDYKIHHQKDNTKIKEGEPIYKLIREDYWDICIVLDKNMAKQLKDREYVRVRFSKDGYLMWAKVRVEKKKKEYIGILSFDTAMVKYAKDRFIHVNLVLEDATGLKIPKSAVTQKNYYQIPSEYLTQGGNAQSYGVLVVGKKGSAEFRPMTQYYVDAENGVAYIEQEPFLEGDSLRKPNSSESFPLRKVETFDGVYNVKRGYASFRQIRVLSESEDYYIVEPISSQSLSNYDFIALYGKDMKENQVIF